MALEPGKKVERYVLEEALGVGGQAEVWRVRHSTLNRLGALKVLKVTSPRFKARLMREGQIQAQLKHPNIVPVIDVLESEDGPALLMDFIEGPSLERWLQTVSPTPETAEALFLQILDGVEAAHARDVVHRDLKPANILLAPLHDGGWRPMVADFGLARAMDEEEGGGARTRTGMAMGTLDYMAPEQVRNAKDADRRADIFALGCILYEMMCGGQRPFPSEDLVDHFERTTSGRYVRPRQIDPRIPERVEAAIAGALVGDRDKRIPDCLTLRSVLQGRATWAEGGVSAPPVGAIAAGPISQGPTLEPTGRSTLAPSMDPSISGVRAAPALSPSVTPSAPPASVAEANIGGSRWSNPLGWRMGLMGGLAAAAALVIAVKVGDSGGLEPPPSAAPSAAPAPSGAPAVEAAPGAAPAPSVPTPAAPSVPAPSVAAPAAEAPRTKVASKSSSSAPPAAPPAATAAPPVEAPAPVEAKPAPAPAPTTASWSVEGDWTVRLVPKAGGSPLSPGKIPPGEYTIRARLDAETVEAGAFTAVAGKSYKITCSGNSGRCVAR